MSWTTAIEDVRNQLSDGATDKLRYKKRCFGKVDGDNLTFKTLEDRRISDFTSEGAPIGAYVDGEIAPVASDNPIVGEFVLSIAPDEGSDVEATYYMQWFLDTDIQKFLGSSTQWLGLGTDWTNIPPGLQYAAMLYSCKLACDKLALKSVDYISDTYQLADAPKADGKSPSQQYLALAKNYASQAEDARKGYYTRQDQSEAPLFASISGAVRDVPPKE